jgi:hypothetical protein
LLDVYAAALVEADEDVDAQTSPMPPRLDFGAHDEYWEVLDPYIEADALIGALSDDVGAVYADRLLADRRQLLDVYTAALSLPLVEATDDGDAQTSPMPPRLDFGAHDEYWEVFDPSSRPTP